MSLDFEALRRSTPSELIRELAQPLTLSGQPVGVGARAAIVQIPAHGRSVTSVLGRGFRLLNTVARSQADGGRRLRARREAREPMAMLERDLAAALFDRSALHRAAAEGRDRDRPGPRRRGAGALAASRARPGCRRRSSSRRRRRAASSSISGCASCATPAVASNKLDGDRAKGLSIAVNVSPHQLAHPDFLAELPGGHRPRGRRAADAGDRGDRDGGHDGRRAHHAKPADAAPLRHRRRHRRFRHRLLQSRLARRASRPTR